MEEKLVGREWVYRPTLHVFNVIAVGDEAATPTIPIVGAKEIVMCAVAVRPGVLKNMAVKRKVFDAWNKVPTPNHCAISSLSPEFMSVKNLTKA